MSTTTCGMKGPSISRTKAQSLSRAGADFIICVSNTWHTVSDQFMQGIDIPLFHIAGPTAQSIKDHGLTKVALLGTKATMSSSYWRDLYTKNYGLEIMVPEEQDQAKIDKVIFEELSYQVFSDESRKAYLEIVDGLASHGAQGVILGCTEIGLLISQADRPAIPMFDTLRLHAKATALKMVYE